MRVKNACSIGVDDVVPNAKSRVVTINMETGNIYCEDDHIKKDEEEEEKREDETLRNEKNSLKQKSSTRLLQIIKSENSPCGFHLTRTKWDPYPWVSAVDADLPAEMSGLKVGDCVLEVNGKDVLGLRITEIAKLVKANSEHVTLLLWSTGHESKSDPKSLCDGPMPHTLQRLSIIVQSILSIIECPVCLDTIPPPAMQCQNGHLLCVNCRIRAEKCPVCRDRYTPKRALIAEQIYAAITNAFNLCRTEDKLRQKLFGTNVKHSKKQEQQQQQQQQQKCEQQKTIVNIGTTSVDKEVNPRALESTTKSPHRIDSDVYRSAPNYKVRIGFQLPTNKFLTKLLLSKACSMDNLSSATTTTTTTTTTINAEAQSTNSDGRMLSCPATPSTLAVSNSSTNSLLPTMKDRAQSIATIPSDMTTTTQQQIQSFSNQLYNLASITTNTVPLKAENHSIPVPKIKDYLGGLTTTNLAKNKITKVNEMSKHFSLSTNDLLAQPRHSRTSNSQLNATGSDGYIKVTKVKPQCALNPNDLLETTPYEEQTIEPRTARKHTSSSNGNSIQCSGSDESNHLTASSGDDSSLPSSLQITPSTTTTMISSSHSTSCSKSPILFILTSDTGSSTIDDFLSTSTPSKASTSSSFSSSSSSPSPSPSSSES